MISRIACCALLAATLGRTLAAEPSVDASALPRVPATEPAKALSTFRVKPGFRLELVAAEPLVVDPIALSFDEDGRCYVVEMRDYSERRPERLGRIRRLEDTNGDGRFDKSTVFAADMPWPTAVICWDGGVFVGATPDIIYFKDTNGDGVADIREPVFTGFAADYAPFATNKLNVQALMNSFNWSLDNRIHGATSFNGGKVKRVDSPFVRNWLKRGGADGVAPPPLLDLRGRDFSIDPRTLEIRAESGGGQYGMSFDNRGRKFVCSNSSHLQTLMYEERYAARNPHFSMPRALVDIAVDGGAAPVFRISPDEPWRVIRTKWRVEGLVPGPVEGGGRPSGYFTGATGVTIYRGDAYGPEFVGNAFVGDAGGNLVHRKLILPDGIGVKGIRPAEETNVEFLASADNWFRPVQMANAPDGCLYICDMYREVIEHPWSLPDSIKKHMDLNSGNNRGRIYRVVPVNFKQRPLPRLGKSSTAELVKVLEHPNGWHRDTAARLLYERNSRRSASAVSKLLVRTTNSVAKVHCLYALASLRALADAQLISALDPRDTVVLENALKLAEPLFANPSPGIRQRVLSPNGTFQKHPADTSADLQIALSLGAVQNTNRVNLLCQRLFHLSPHFAHTNHVEQNEGVKWITAALLNGIGDDSMAMLKWVVKFKGGNPAWVHDNLIAQTAQLVGARNRQVEVRALIDFAAFHAQPIYDVFDSLSMQDSWRMISGLAAGLRQSGGSLGSYREQGLEKIYRLARLYATDTHNSLPVRLTAIEALGTASYSEARSNLLALIITNDLAPAIRTAALAALANTGNGAFANDLLRVFFQLPPTLRGEVVALLLRRPAWTRALLAALQKGELNPGELSTAQQSSLLTHRDTSIQSAAREVFGASKSASQQAAVEAYQPALALNGVATNGRTIFMARCATCHKAAGQGQPLGPDLATVKNAGKEKILVNILDPNREVNSNYLAYMVETKDGESLVGLLVNQSGNSVTLRMAGGIETVVSRTNIASMQSQGRSLMPEGLEEGLTAQDMADLLEFILAP